MKRWASISELAAERNKSPRQMRRIVAKYAKDFPSLIRREPIRKSKIEVDRRAMKQLQTAVEEASPPNLYELRTEVERLRYEVSDLRREVAIVYKCIKQLGESSQNRSK